MTFSESYLGELRRKVGHDLIQVPGGRIIIEDEIGSILLQLRSDFKVWGLPAGSPEKGEKAIDSIVRETFEETGLKILNVNCYGYSSNPDYEIIEYPNGDKIHNYSLLYYTHEWKGDLITSNEESIELCFFNPLELPQMISNHKRSIEMYLSFKRTGDFQID